MTELKLRLLKLAGGDLQRAKNTLEWILKDDSSTLEDLIKKEDPGPDLAVPPGYHKGNSIPHGFIQRAESVVSGNTVVSTSGQYINAVKPIL